MESDVFEVGYPTGGNAAALAAQRVLSAGVERFGLYLDQGQRVTLLDEDVWTGKLALALKGGFKQDDVLLLEVLFCKCHRFVVVGFVHQDRILKEQAGNRADHVSAFGKQFDVFIPIFGGWVFVHAVAQLGGAGTRDFVVGLGDGKFFIRFCFHLGFLANRRFPCVAL